MKIENIFLLSAQFGPQAKP